jgi:hypothetical protein
MNLKLFTFSCSLLVAFTVLLTACTKEGPAGPAGAAGPAGPTGPAGGQGPKGDTGTANVIYSNWLDVTFDADTVQNGTIIDTVGFSTLINAPKLTNTILSTGEIKVYWNYGTAASPVVFPLPLDLATFNGVYLSPFFQVGSIALISNADLSTFSPAANTKRFQFRYVLIPGGTPSGRMATVNWNDYNAVKAYLGLKD